MVFAGLWAMKYSLLFQAVVRIARDLSETEPIQRRLAAVGMYTVAGTLYRAAITDQANYLVKFNQMRCSALFL